MPKITVIRENEERDIDSSLLKKYEIEGFRELVSEPSEIIEDEVIEEKVEETKEVENYNELTLKDLKAIAKERGFVGYSNFTKEQLVELLQNDK